MELTNREWKEFLIDDLFRVKIGKNIDGNKINKFAGVSPYITRKESNNGLDGFIDFSDDLLNKDFPVITIGNETAEPFVQEFPFFTGTKVNILIPKASLSSKVLFFISTSLKAHKSKYSYSFTINSTRLKRQKILLPVTTNGKPDYAFMESYMKNKEAELLDKYENYVSINIKQLQLKTNKEVEWNSFEIGNLFEIENCKCSKVSELKLGNIPYVGATNRNNGVISFVEERNELVTKGNCIAFICDGEGSVGFSIYKAEDFIGSTTVKVGRNPNLNIYNGMFITTIADTVRSKYNFGFKRCTSSN